MPRVEGVVLILSPRSLRPVLLYRRSDLFQVAVSLTLAAPEGVLVDLERVAEDALRDRGNERVVVVVERVFRLHDMSGEQHLELLGLGEGRQGVLPRDGRERRPGGLKLRLHGLDDRMKAGLRGAAGGRGRRAAVKPVNGHCVAPRGEAEIKRKNIDLLGSVLINWSVGR